MIHRYDYVGGSYPMRRKVNGEYVEYEDHASEVARLTSIISEQQLELDDMRARMLAVLQNYEELRSIIGGGSKSMTHAEAVAILSTW